MTISATKDTMDSLRQPLQDVGPLTCEWEEGLYRFVDLEYKKKNVGKLVNVMLERLQLGWLHKILSLNYNYFDPKETVQILAYAKADLAEHGKFHYEHMHAVLAEYLETSDYLNIDGFVRFRMKEYWEYLVELIDSSVDDYLVDQEYQEFIKLLSYFVELQEPKRGLVNVIMDEHDRFYMLDELGQVVETDYLEGVILEIGQNELDLEDLLISALITVAPAQIVYHAHNNADERIAQTISSIFATRARICTGCSICSDIGHCRKGK